jgi:hypothetical protein
MVNNKGDYKMDAISLTYPISLSMPENVKLSSFEIQAIAEEVLGGFKRGKEQTALKSIISDCMVPHDVELSSDELAQIADACQEVWDRSNGPNFIVKTYNDEGRYGGCGYFDTLTDAIEYKIRQEDCDRVAEVYRLVEFNEVPGGVK